ncbi:hypothetical protein GCM10009837_20170 [Streptomyces durmitorensis]|uniref:STAS domain-containing protein n=1 Tax=Streptomyces durmitorensis TaxID=319947 RepID=A0ABY4PPH7_9ACTN|nr:hypothetical protein [Streptomyces durmitorensis]UQT55327.1 hypothetical protein M4V62_09575 [Streptomyces durmitorensis]
MNSGPRQRSAWRAKDRRAIREALPCNPPFLTLALTGELDVINIGKLSDTIIREFEAGRRHLLLEFTGVTWRDAYQGRAAQARSGARSHRTGYLLSSAPPVNSEPRRSMQ